jgi:hypothetical protein
MTKESNNSTRTCKNCLRVVQNDGMQLQYMENQTPELCLAAVRQIDQALQFVKQQSLAGLFNSGL